MNKSVIGSVLLAVLICFSVSSAYSREFSAPLITAVSGNVKVMFYGDKWVQAKTNMRLRPGSKIKTDVASMIDLTYDEDGVDIVTVDEYSDITLGGNGLFLSNGAVFVKFVRLGEGGSFTVNAPFVSASIREANCSGMEVEFRNNGAYVLAFQDYTFVQCRDENGISVGDEIKLLPGQKMYVAEDGTAGSVADISDTERAVWDTWAIKVPEEKALTGHTARIRKEKEDFLKYEKDSEIQENQAI